MFTIYALNEKIVEKFKQPFGLLIKGTASETSQYLKELFGKEKPTKIITVGDKVSRNLSDRGISVQLSIIDNKSMRKRVKPLVLGQKTLLKVKNPPGTITEEAIFVIRKALHSQKQVSIVVEGEEDLLALPAVLYAPENSAVIYGQPYVGVVVVKVTPEKKEEARKLLDEMACSGKAK